MKIDKKEIKRYLSKRFEGNVKDISVKKLGSGVLGTGYSLNFKHNNKDKKLVLKSLFTSNLGKDHFSDRAQSLILAHDSYNQMKNHIRSHDVISLQDSGKLFSLGNPKEFFILMETAQGKDLFNDLEDIKSTGILKEEHKKKIILLSDFLVNIHKKKHKDISLYRRKIRDTIGSGESLLGILDMYPDKEYHKFENSWKKIIKISIDYWSISRTLVHRLSEIHGDFHPGNLWFKEDKLTILDRARGRFGEPADDISAFIINLIFFSVIKEGSFKGEFKEIFDIFWNNYFKKTKDREMRKILAPYLAFRAAVICNPLFYNDDFFNGKEKAASVREKMINFALNSLQDKEFFPEKIDDYLLA